MSNHFATYLVFIGGAVVIAGSIVLRLRYGPRNIFGKYTKPIVYGLLGVLALWNLYLGTQERDAWYRPQLAPIRV